MPCSIRGASQEAHPTLWDACICIGLELEAERPELGFGGFVQSTLCPQMMGGAAQQQPLPECDMCRDLAHLIIDTNSAKKCSESAQLVMRAAGVTDQLSTACTFTSAMATFTPRHSAAMALCVRVATVESREFDDAEDVPPLAPSLKRESLVPRNQHSDWNPSVLARQWAVGLTPLLRIDDVDANHEGAIKAAVNILAWETSKRLTEQYPFIRQSDIYVVFGLTSLPVGRTVGYYVAGRRPKEVRTHIGNSIVPRT